jgi:hypothetical protein
MMSEMKQESGDERASWTLLVNAMLESFQRLKGSEAFQEALGTLQNLRAKEAKIGQYLLTS